MPPASLNLGTNKTPAGSSRNIAVLSIFGVIAGGYALMRYQTPREGVVKEDDVANTTGPTKLGRSKVISQGDVKATMGDPPTGHGHVARSPRQASDRGDI
ncbi:hypothetical protein BDW62DRAFT_197953 [Aspergillus aurantiobrunneus]